MKSLVHSISKHKLPALVVLILLTVQPCLAEPLIAKAQIGDSMEFSVSFAKDTYLTCEGVWAMFKLRNTSPRLLQVQYPCYYEGNVSVKLIDSSGETTYFDRGCWTMPEPGKERTIGLAVGDSLLSVLDFADQHGHLHGWNFGLTLCHLVGQFDATISYDPTKTALQVNYVVREAANLDESRQLEELRVINDDVHGVSLEWLEGRLNRFFVTHQNSVLLPTAWRLWHSVHYVKQEPDTNKWIAGLKDYIHQFPNDPGDNHALNHIVQLRCDESTEKYFAELSRQKNTLAGWFAGLKLRHKDGWANRKKAATL